MLNSIFCQPNEKFGAHVNFFLFFAHGIFAQKIKLFWKISVLNKKHLILLHTLDSVGVPSCTKTIAFFIFFSSIGERKTIIPTQLTYFYVLKQTKHSYFCFFCFCSWIDSKWEETWFFIRTLRRKNPQTVFRRNENIFSFTVSCLHSQLRFTQVWSPHFCPLRI